MANRTKGMQFRVNESEQASLRKAAKTAGLGISEYLRGLTLEPTVIVVGQTEVTLLPGKADTDEELGLVADRLRVVLAGLQGQAPGGTSSVPAPAPALPPTSVPSEPGSAVGASTPAPAESPAAGAPGSGREVCPACGGVNGQHQSFCETVRGEAPVEERPEPGGAPPAGPVENQEQFVNRRIEEQRAAGEDSDAVALAIAEAEWRRAQSGEAPAPPTPTSPAPAAPRRAPEPCPTCGTMKQPEAQCLDCGRRPTV